MTFPRGFVVSIQRNDKSSANVRRVMFYLLARASRARFMTLFGLLLLGLAIIGGRRLGRYLGLRKVNWSFLLQLSLRVYTRTRTTLSGLRLSRTFSLPKVRV
jgi:ribosomal protein L30/L7E